MVDKCNRLFRLCYSLRQDFECDWFVEGQPPKSVSECGGPTIDSIMEMGDFNAYDAYVNQVKFPIEGFSI